jgi:predicted ATPase/DNA-binding SARP family transcriptional activator
VDIEFRVLGEVALLRDGERHDLGGKRARSVLAALLVQHAPVTQESLIDRLWPDDPPATATKTVQVYVSRIRTSLGSQRTRLASRKGGYELHVEPGELDADAFADAAGRARELLDEGSGPAALSALDEASRRWHGHPFGDLADEPFLRGEVQRLEDLAADVTELRARAFVAAGLAAEAVGQLRTLVADQPARESAWSQLLLALFAAGRQADALAAYREAREYLDDELGIDPGPELEAAHLAVLQQTAPVRSSFGARTAGVSTGPSATDGLFGRDEDIARIEAALDHGSTLVTLAGTGGIGKTTLCRALLERQRAAGANRVVFVELDGLRDPDLVPAAVAAALGGTEEAAVQIGMAQAVIGLDNFEQVARAASWVGGLLRSCPQLRLIVTSRKPLRVWAEHVHRLGPLDGAAASQLFLARARRVRPDLDPSSEIDSICERVDRVPLAIELAAARTNLLSPAALLARLDRTLETLAANAPERGDRQHTLRSTIAWSYGLLDTGMQLVFRRLSVFSGGFTFGAAEAVTAASLDDLDALVSQSLLAVRYDRQEPRLSMLETIREFAAERLDAEDDAAAVRAGHAAWARALVDRVVATGRLDDRHVRELVDELDNMRAAMAWAGANGDEEMRLRIAVGLSDVWQTQGFLVEAGRWLEPGLDSATIPDDLRAEALDDASAMAFRQGQLETARSLAERLLALATRLGQSGRQVGALARLAQIAIRFDDVEKARALHVEALAIASQVEDRRPLLVSLTSQANADLLAGNADHAAAAFEELLGLARDVGRPESVATAYFNLGLARLIAARDLTAARSALAEALRRYAALDDTEGIGYVLVAAASLTADADPTVAAQALGAAGAALSSVDADLEAVEASLQARTVERLVQSMGRAPFEQAKTAGTALTASARLALAELAVGPGEGLVARRG